MANGTQDTNTFIKLLYGLLRRQRSQQVSDGQGVGRPLTREESIMGLDPVGITTDVQNNLIFPLDCGHSGSSTVAGTCFCGAWTCPSCFSICARCAKPLCGAHRKPFQEKYFCEECLPKEKAKARWERIKEKLRRKDASGDKRSGQRS